MELNVKRSDICNILEVVEKGLPLRSTLPVINNIFLEIFEEKLSFSSTNLEIFVQASINYKSSEKAQILLPPKFVELFRYFPTEDVNIEINFENYQIDIKGGSSQFRLYGADTTDYPAFGDNILNDKRYSMKKGLLKSVLRKTIFAASSDETRPAFNGVFFSFNDNSLLITASDTYRLVSMTIRDDQWQFPSKNCLVPAKAMRELLRILDDKDTMVEFSMENGYITFYLDGIVFATRLLQEKFPEVSGVIPKEYKTRVKVERKSIEDSVTRATLLTEGKNQAVNINVSDEHIEVKVASQLGSMEEKVVASLDGEPISLLVNTRFMLDFLKIINDQDIIIDFHGDGNPIVFRLIDNNNFLYLVLPIKKLAE